MIGITMRMMRMANNSGEIRDCLDHAWWNFLQTALPDRIVLPLPNAGRRINEVLRNLPWSGFILTGGDDWGIFPDRDETEQAIVAFAQEQDLPLLGICRGAQIINVLAGGSLMPGDKDSHVCKRHELVWSKSLPAIDAPDSCNVNSYHRLVLDKLAEGAEVLATAKDGTVEAYSLGKSCGLLWHPERESVPQALDIKIFANIFKRKES